MNKPTLNKVDQLKEKIEIICNINGHIMGEWIAPNRDGRLISVCEKCGRKAIIDLVREYDDTIIYLQETFCHIDQNVMKE